MSIFTDESTLKKCAHCAHLEAEKAREKKPEVSVSGLNGSKYNSYK